MHLLAIALLLGLASPGLPTVHGPRRTTDHHPAYRFSARGAAGFRCSFDRPRLHRCRARYSQRLRTGKHTLRVQAVDRAGRRSRVRRVTVRILAAEGPRLTKIQVGARPFSLVEADGSIWVASFLAGTVQRIDPATNRVTATLQVGGQPYGLTAGGGSIWVGNNALDSVARIDTATNRVVATVPVGDRPIGLAYDAGTAAVWVADFGDGAVTEIDAATNAVRRRAVIAGEHEDVALGFGSIWIPSEEGTLTRVDRATLTPTAVIPVAADPDYALVASGYVWTTAYRGSVISRIDPAANAVAGALPAHGGLQGIDFDGSAFWAAGYDEDLLLEIDPASGRILGRWPTDAGPRDVLVAAGSVWVASSRGSTVLRLTPRA